MRSTQVTVTLVLLLAGPALAADVLVPQKKLLLKSSSGAGVFSKARSSTIPLPATPPTFSGGQVRVCTDTDPVGVVFPLPSADWDGIGNVTTIGYRYDNPDPGPGECTNVLLKGDRFIKTRCEATGITQPATGRVHLRIRIGSNDYCTDCATDGSAGTVRQNTAQRTVIANCPAPASCPCSASPSGAFLDAAALF